MLGYPLVCLFSSIFYHHQTDTLKFTKELRGCDAILLLTSSYCYLFFAQFSRLMQDFDLSLIGMSLCIALQTLGPFSNSMV
jgi:hypothetical protein